MIPRAELVFFRGCPHASDARANLSSALAEMFPEVVEWEEWDLLEPETPERLMRFGSPTVLVEGRDVTGPGPESRQMSCRADGAPSRQVILEALRRASTEA